MDPTIFPIGLGILFVATMVFSIAWAQTRVAARKPAKREYDEALAAYRNDPANAALKLVALQKGRAYSNLMRDANGISRYDEAALKNDLDAVEIKASPSPADRLKNLAQMRDDGLISQGEYETKRVQILEDL